MSQELLESHQSSARVTCRLKANRGHLRNTLFTKWMNGWVCEDVRWVETRWVTIPHTHTHMHTPKTNPKKQTKNRRITDTSAAFFFQITPLGCDRRRACPTTMQRNVIGQSDLCFRLKKGYCIFKRLTGLTKDREQRALHVKSPFGFCFGLSVSVTYR